MVKMSLHAEGDVHLCCKHEFWMACSSITDMDGQAGETQEDGDNPLLHVYMAPKDQMGLWRYRTAPVGCSQGTTEFPQLLFFPRRMGVPGAREKGAFGGSSSLGFEARLFSISL